MYLFSLINIYKLVSWTLYIYEEAEWRGSHGFIDPAAAAASPFFFSSTEAIILVYTAWLYCVCAGNYFTQINAYIVYDDEEKNKLFIPFFGWCELIQSHRDKEFKQSM